MARLHFMNHLVTAFNVLTTQKMKKSRNLHAPHLMQLGRHVLLVTLTGSTFITSIQSVLSGMKLCVRRLRTTTRLQPVLGVRMDLRFLSAHCVVQLTSSKSALRNAVIRVNLNLHMCLFLKFWSAGLKTAKELF